MMPGKIFWKPLVRKLVTGRFRRMRMGRLEPSALGTLKNPGLYLHVPFCKNLCAFCPYHRVEYDDRLFDAYEKAVLHEIDRYADKLGGAKWVSLYIGGGTPTVNLPGLLRILDRIRQRFAVACDICIELHPANMEPECLGALKNAGVTQVSIGVESATDRLLESIGRNHDAKTAIDSLKRAVETGFDSVNADLLFALPGQTLEEWEHDVKAVIDAGADQVSTYPLFTFPYSDLGQSEKVRRIRRPGNRRIRSQLDRTGSLAENAGFKRSAVWSWKKPGRKKFSSITRHHYIGLGPSAASMTGRDFYVNTFDVEEYARSVPAGRQAALSLPVDRRLEMAYWFYWRIYELEVDGKEFAELFGGQETLDAVFGNVIRPFQKTGMIERRNGGYAVTDSGAFWIHRLQNEYSLNYINRLWGACRKEARPREVVL